MPFNPTCRSCVPQNSRNWGCARWKTTKRCGAHKYCTNCVHSLLWMPLSTEACTRWVQTPKGLERLSSSVPDLETSSSFAIYVRPELGQLFRELDLIKMQWYPDDKTMKGQFRRLIATNVAGTTIHRDKVRNEIGELIYRFTISFSERGETRYVKYCKVPPRIHLARSRLSTRIGLAYFNKHCINIPLESGVVCAVSPPING